MQVEDHPIEYGDFEGVIPEGQYGAGKVIVWDQGTWDVPVNEALPKGDLKFTLHGKKLRGSWVLVRTQGYGGKRNNAWLLIKHRDEYVSKKDITETMPRSVLTGRLLAQIGKEEIRGRGPKR
jgi:bifunctional non-homologous end joining protein LigD